LSQPPNSIADIRRFRVNLNIVNKPLVQQLLMTTTARKGIVQSIPI
jgi:hypothetical protein